MSTLASIPDPANIPVVVMAGGQSQRLTYQDKPKWQLPFGEHRLIDYIVNRLKQQTKTIVINARTPGNPALLSTGLPIIADLTVAGHPQTQAVAGPIAGLIAALQWGKEQQIPWIATTPCDTPFFPDSLLKNLCSGLKPPHKAAVACEGNQLHAVFGLWQTDLYNALISRVTHDNIRSINKWAYQCATHVDFSDANQRSPQDIFLNINTPADYQQALAYINQNK